MVSNRNQIFTNHTPMAHAITGVIKFYIYFYTDMITIRLLFAIISMQMISLREGKTIITFIRILHTLSSEYQLV